jgi:hypothetical protein
VALKADSRSHGEEWLASRDWLFRACVLLILAYVLLLASYAFRPLLIPCLLVAIAYLYAAGRFAWHVQRNARNRQMAIARTQLQPIPQIGGAASGCRRSAHGSGLGRAGSRGYRPPPPHKRVTAGPADRLES